MTNRLPWILLSVLAAIGFFSIPVEAQWIVAHRGASHDAPENTLAAFRLAWEQGADGIEGDFWLSADGEVVCIHDDTTERTAGKNLNVAHSTLAELRELDVGRWKSERFAGERIPTLQEVIATVPDGRKMVIELKCGPEVVDPLQKIVNDSALRKNQILIISFKEATIAAAKNALPGVKAHWLTDYSPDDDRGPWTPTVGEIAKTLRETGADGLGSKGHRAVFDKGLKDQLADVGVQEVHVWTIDDPEEAAFFRSQGVWGITTNRPALIREALEKSSAR